MRVRVADEVIREAFEGVKDRPGFAESAALVARGRRPVEMLQAMALRPALLTAFAGISDAVYSGGQVEREVKEIIILEASRRNTCQFCTQSHISMARQLGMSDQPLSLLDRADQLPPRQQAALSYTRVAMADSNNIPEQVWSELHAVFSDAEIVEVTAMIGLLNMLNLFNNCLDVRYNGEYEAG